MKHIKLFESFEKESYYYDEVYDYGDVSGIIHNDFYKTENWLNKRGLELKDYKKYIKLPIAFLNNINVYDEYRGQGHGFDLYDQFEDFCIENEATGILLESDSDEEQQKGFNLDNWYKRLDFEIIGESRGNKIMYKELETW